DVHGLGGRPGAGKSTWARAPAARVPVEARALELDAGDPRTLGAAERRAAYARVGLVFQDPASSLNPRRTVGWSIGEPLQLAGRSSRAGIGRRGADALQVVRLPASYASRLPHELSGGQRQRVSIARALIRRPCRPIAAAPSCALAASIQAPVIGGLRGAVGATQFACVFFSHALAVVGSLADRVTVLRAGRAVEQGSA